MSKALSSQIPGPLPASMNFSLSMLMSIYLFDAPMNFMSTGRSFSVIRLNSCENVTGSNEKSEETGMSICLRGVESYSIFPSSRNRKFTRIM